MRHVGGLLAVWLISAASSRAAVFTVLNNKDAGNGSLRQAIAMANSNLAADTLTFDATLMGKVIALQSPLPALTEPGTHIDGDLNDDTKPDVTLDGSAIAGLADGLYVFTTANSTVIEGLAIVDFSDDGITIDVATDCVIESCHLGVNRAGTVNRPNGGSTGSQVLLRAADRARVGMPGKPNVISAGASVGSTGAVLVRDTRDAVVGPNLVGLTRDGTAALGNGINGVTIVSVSSDCSRNTVRDCVFAGLAVGVWLTNTHDNKVQGCTFGLAADGLTPLGSGQVGIFMRDGAFDNLIGGPQRALRNVFVAPAGKGVWASAPGTQANRIQGNYFGTDLAGEQQLGLNQGVVVDGDAGSQLIGGPGSTLGNYFASYFGEGVVLSAGGWGSTIRYNRLGVLPHGGDVPGLSHGVRLESMSATITDNAFALVNDGGVLANGAGATPDVYRNSFRRCGVGVRIQDGAQPRLGNLANAGTWDDGGNRFQNTLSFHIVNVTPNYIRAEGNTFGTTVQAAIDAKITDKLDNGAYGRVDFDPLQGGISPTGGAEGAAALAVTGATALPTSRGAEIAFSLSAPASVTVEVLNLAGRPVVILARDRRADPGSQRLAWNGLSASGTAAPPGRYLVRIIARSADGGQASALLPVSLTR